MVFLIIICTTKISRGDYYVRAEIRKIYQITNREILTAGHMQTEYY